MKISKSRLKEIIREEYQRSTPPGDGFGDSDDGYPPERPSPSLGNLQSDEKFTGGTPEEQMLTRIKARDLLAAMSKEELKELSLSLDAETVAELRHLLANPMYAAKTSAPDDDEMELQEAPFVRKRYGHAAKNPSPPEPNKGPAKPPRGESDTRSSNDGYRPGGTGKKNQGHGGY